MSSRAGTISPEPAEGAASQAATAKAPTNATATAPASAAAAVATAERDLVVAQANLQQLCASQPGLRAELDSALARLEAVRPAYEEAQAKRALGSKGFFHEHEAPGAAEALETATYASATNLGAEGDATSLENMRRSFQFMKECNAIRESEGLPALKVTHSMMAYAQSNVNWSVNSCNHAHQFNVGENLALGYDAKPYELGRAGNADEDCYDNPFCGWYDKEKACLETGEGVVGHYRNIVSKLYTVTGFAVADGADGRMCHSQTFQWRIPNDETTYTVDEYEQLFEAYLTPVLAAEEEHAAAQEAVAKAEAEHNGAGEKIEEAERAAAAAQQALDAAKARAEEFSSVSLNAKTVTAAKVSAAINARGVDATSVKTVVLGPKVAKIGAKAFASASGKQVKAIEIKTTKLTKASVRNSLKGSKVKAVKVSVGDASENKRYVKAYKKVFAKKNAGKKVTVK